MSAEANQTHHTTITIDGKSYDINCPLDKVSELQVSATYLDNKIREIRDNHGSTLPTERIAMITALNMAHELLQQKRDIEASISTMDYVLNQQPTAKEQE